MILSIKNLKPYIATKAEASSVLSDYWLARSAINIKVGNLARPIFGFAAGLNRAECEMRAEYELYERLAFLPYLYTQDKLQKMSFYAVPRYKKLGSTLTDFLIGASGPRGKFSANGCALGNTLYSAIKHAKRELLERHLCCELWYQKNKILVPVDNFKLSNLSSRIKLNFYTTHIPSPDQFAVAVLYYEPDFFVLGAAIRDTLPLACLHAASEVFMLLEDAVKNRDGSGLVSLTPGARKNILMLRNKNISLNRRNYFHQLLENKKCGLKNKLPSISTVWFKPASNLYAVRAVSDQCLDPREFGQENVPGLPLF